MPTTLGGTSLTGTLDGPSTASTVRIPAAAAPPRGSRLPESRVILPAVITRESNNVGQWIVPVDRTRYTARRGSIRNVTFRSTQFFGEKLPSSLFIGYDQDHAIDNVTFDDVYFNGQRLPGWPESKVLTRNASNARIVE